MPAGRSPPDHGLGRPLVRPAQPAAAVCTQADIRHRRLATLGAPLVNPNTGNNLSRTETGPVLLEGIQGFLGQTNVIECGKKAYAVGRERRHHRHRPVRDHARRGRPALRGRGALGARHSARPGEPVRDCDATASTDRPDRAPPGRSPGPRARRRPRDPLPDVDNYPFGWAGTAARWAPRTSSATATYASATATSSRAASTRATRRTSGRARPTPGTTSCPPAARATSSRLHGQPTDCYDGLRNFNQVRPAVFDGGYAFGTARPASPTCRVGSYIVEAIAPPGYVHIKEEDKNVDFGDSYIAAERRCSSRAECVGRAARCRSTSTLFPDQQVATRNVPYVAGQDVAAVRHEGRSPSPRARTPRPTSSCSPRCRSPGTSSASSSTTCRTSSTRTRRPSARSTRRRGCRSRSATGPATEIARVYSDQYGTYNALVPSTFTINAAVPARRGAEHAHDLHELARADLDTRPGSPTSAR